MGRTKHLIGVKRICLKESMRKIGLEKNSTITTKDRIPNHPWNRTYKTMVVKPKGPKRGVR